MLFNPYYNFSLLHYQFFSFFPLYSKLYFCSFFFCYIVTPGKSLLSSFSVQYSHSFMSSSFQPHESQHARPPCPSPTPRVYPNSWPSSQWYHPTISYSVIPFSSCPQSLQASGSFPVSQLFAWGGQSIEFQLQHQSFQWTPRVGSPCSMMIKV